jgi:NAD(P)-dependent dehydrogenase (short-subunit alcohol dehydrogenase family)
MIELDLSGQTALVTGAGRGIGERIAHRFAAAGANIVAAARTESEIQATVDSVEEEHGVEGLAVPTDLMEREDIDNLVDEAIDEFGLPEILVNNAALNLAGPLLDMPLEDVDAMLSVNLRGLFLLSQRWSKEVREGTGEGRRIVNISSATSHLGVPRMTLYTGTNGGINSVTRGFAAEMAADGVTVNTVTPGLIGIDRIENLVEEQGDEIYDLDRIPLERLGDPDDIANACLFYASDLSEYVTGTELVVDGGVTFTAGLYK